MTITKEAFVDLNEKYNKVIKLITDDCKLDPENEPYLSKYQAREILLSMKANLENILRNPPEDKSKTHIKAMLGAVQLYLGIVSIDTEELSIGEGHLKKCQEIVDVDDEINKPEMIMVGLNMYNQFGILWSESEPEKSKSYLEKSQQLYQNYKETTQPPPIDISDLFQMNLDAPNIELAWKNYEKVYTFTLYYLAQIYGALKDALKSSIYCHITLQRQLDANDYDRIDWALNAATLSQFFMEKNGFKQARHHLSASSYMLDKYQHELELNQQQSNNDRDENYDAKMEQFKHRSADVARCWAKYGLLLLSKSKERLLEQTDADDNIIDIDRTTTAQSDLLKNDYFTNDELEHLIFTKLDLNDYEKQITYKYILTIQDARIVFLNIQQWLHKAAQYYTLESLASDHIEIVQDQSQMYLNLLFFEDNPDHQAKLHKRRIDLLENVINNINPQYYLQYCRQIWFELGQIYYDILNIKSDKLRDLNQRPTPQQLTKINHLIDKSIDNFQCFIDSFKDGTTTAASGKLPDKIQEEFEKPFLQAIFHIAALNSRYITLDKQMQSVNVEKSLIAYQHVVDYCKDNDAAQQALQMELSICKEMVNLLPVKIAKLQHEANL